MAWTMINLEGAIIDRAEGWFDFLEWNKTPDGTNSYCGGPIADALLTLEYTVTDLSQPADADLSSVSSDKYLALLEVADFYMHEKILSNIGKYSDVKVGQREERMAQMADSLEKLVNKKEAAIREKYQLFYGVPSLAKVNLNFQTKGDDSAPTAS